MAQDDYSFKRSLDLMNDKIDDNTRAIERNYSQNEEAHTEIMDLLRDIRVAVYGNGEPELGIRYRVAWLERTTRIDNMLIRLMAVIAAINLVATVLLGILIFYHVV